MPADKNANTFVTLNEVMKKFFVCNCFYTNNYFLKKYNIHVTYNSKEQFVKQFSKVLKDKGCITESQFEDVIQEICHESDRRRKLGQSYLERKKIIQDRYVRKHPDIFTLKDEHLSPEFVSLVNLCKDPKSTYNDVVSEIHREEAEQCFTFPVFTEEFCKVLMDELEHFEGSDCPRGRPNTMNNYGLLLNEIGFDDRLLSPLRERYLQPITAILFPEYGGDDIDSHKAFVVKYKMDEDLDLNYHYDNAEITINIALGKDYTDGNLYFGSMRTELSRNTQYKCYKHQLYMGLLHRGQHMHGAEPITSGERYNLIMWMRSSKIRNDLCPMCNDVPKLVETVGFGDGFTKPEEEVINVCAI